MVSPDVGSDVTRSVRYKSHDLAHIAHRTQPLDLKHEVRQAMYHPQHLLASLADHELLDIKLMTTNLSWQPAFLSQGHILYKL